MLIQYVVSGISVGCVYALAAMGFVLVYRTLGIINFAQADILTAGVYIAGSIAVTPLLGNGLVQMMLLIPAMAIFGAVMYLVVFRWLIGRGFLNSVIATAVVGMLLRALILAVYGPVPKSQKPLLGDGRYSLGSAVVTVQQLVVVGVTALIAIALYAGMQWTTLGKILRALASDFEMARLAGVRVHLVGAVVLAVSCILAGLSGYLVAPTLVITPSLGSPLLLALFTAVVVGGFGSIPGAAVGGLVVGLVENLAAGYISSTYQVAFLFIILSLVLLFRPRGLFGEHLARRF